ncbi:hypothetical protein ACP70R_020810 [Stipagrostis hirtigluma subsp. patula]
MSSPARSTVSAASGGIVSAAEDVADSIDALYRKDEAMAELKSEVMEALQKEVKSLDDDSWMFAAPRSRINLVSRPGVRSNGMEYPMNCSTWMRRTHDELRLVATCPSIMGKSRSRVKHRRRQGTSRM